MASPKVCVLRTAGTNCDKETAFAFLKAGAEPELVHVNGLISGQKRLDDYQILALPGGFSYGDDIAAGKILANELKCRLSAELKKFVGDGKLIIGICNGFQVLVKSGLLPGNDLLEQEASLIINDSAKFEDRWVYLKVNSIQCAVNRKCVWTRGLPEVIYLPVAHGEGKFVAKDKQLVNSLKHGGQVVFQYCKADGAFAGYPYNPNGSMESIAGICDDTGRILGLMPHPERHIEALQHPRSSGSGGQGDGLRIFKNGVEYIKKNI